MVLRGRVSGARAICLCTHEKMISEWHFLVAFRVCLRSSGFHTLSAARVRLGRASTSEWKCASARYSRLFRRFLGTSRNMCASEIVFSSISNLNCSVIWKIKMIWVPHFFWGSHFEWLGFTVHRHCQRHVFDWSACRHHYPRMGSRDMLLEFQNHEGQGELVGLGGGRHLEKNLEQRYDSGSAQALFFYSCASNLNRICCPSPCHTITVSIQFSILLQFSPSPVSCSRSPPTSTPAPGISGSTG